MKNSIVFILLLSLSVCMPCILSAQQNTLTPEVKFKAREKNYFGLPVVVSVEVSNKSTENIKILFPEERFMQGEVKKDGQLLEHTQWLDYVLRPGKEINLRPGEQVQGRRSLSKYFGEPLPVGEYTCQVTYPYGIKSRLEIQSPVLSFSVVEPTEESLKEAMNLFMGAKYSSEGGSPEQAKQAIQDLATLLAKYPDTDYASVGSFQKARAHWRIKEYSLAIESFQYYLENPPEIYSREYESIYIEFLIADLYYRLQNFEESKRIFTKIVESADVSPSLIQRSQFRLNEIEKPAAERAVFE